MDESDTPEPGVRRRTVLLGSAATAAAAITGVGAASPEVAGAATETAAASPAAFAGSVQAVDVEVTNFPDGTVTPTNAQFALENLDGRLSINHVIDDMQTAMIVVDDFMGGSVGEGAIGELGWSRGASIGTVALAAATSLPGIVKLGPGVAGSPNAYTAINLGYKNLKGCPKFVYEVHCRLEAKNTSTDQVAVYFGLADKVTAQEPAAGCYFRYSGGASATWWAVCANASGFTEVPIPMASGDIAKWHRFRMSSDGTGVRVHVDGVELLTGSPITTNLPPSVSPAAWTSPTIGIRTLVGNVDRMLWVDFFALRWEVAR